MGLSDASYLILGAGVFGVSTAYHLIKQHPNASITLVDKDDFNAEERQAASWDWNKVVRGDYDNLIYCRLALEAQDIFKSDPLWKPFFHETGIYWICRTDFAQKVINSYAALGRRADIVSVPVEEARQMYGGLFKDADYTGGVKSVLVNKATGWGAAADCLRAITAESVRLGVRYVTAEATELRFDDNGRCIGARTSAGDMEASHTIICTGASTARLLESSAVASGLSDLRAGPRIVAAGVVTGMVKLDEKAFSKFESMPVAFQGYSDALDIGSLPPTKDRELKWWGQKVFTNLEEVSGGQISAPPSDEGYSQWNVPQKLQNEIAHAKDVFYWKDSSNWKVEKYRICWDAFTPSADFIISPHSAAQGLYLATGGSLHGFKFFPILGKYVLQMLEGSMSSELRDKWAWNREIPDPIISSEYPRYRWRDLQD